jgi:hypothetical protein
MKSDIGLKGDQGTRRMTAVAGDGREGRPYNGGGSRLEERPWLPAARSARSARFWQRRVPG